MTASVRLFHISEKPGIDDCFKAKPKMFGDQIVKWVILFLTVCGING